MISHPSTPPLHLQAEGPHFFSHSESHLRESGNRIPTLSPVDPPTSLADRGSSTWACEFVWSRIAPDYFADSPLSPSSFQKTGVRGQKAAGRYRRMLCVIKKVRSFCVGSNASGYKSPTGGEDFRSEALIWRAAMVSSKLCRVSGQSEEEERAKSGARRHGGASSGRAQEVRDRTPKFKPFLQVKGAYCALRMAFGEAVFVV